MSALPLGEVLGFKETELTHAGTTSKNSTSLQRAPGPPDESTRGSSTNYPFWPGGFDADDDVVEEVRDHLIARVHAAEGAGIPTPRLWIDPGIGFGKTLDHNLLLFQELEVLVRTGYPVLLGASRKTFIGTLTDQPEPRERVAGSIACAIRGMEAGVRAVRVHDVRATHDALRVHAALG